MTSTIKQIGNIIWLFLCLGFIPALNALFFGAILCCTIVMAPVGLGLIEIGKFYLAPFSRSLVYKDSLKRRRSSSIWNAFSVILLLIYIPFGIIQCCCLAISIAICFVSIYCIPLIIPALKSIEAIFNPIGIICVSDEVKDALDRKIIRKQIRYIDESSTSSSYSSRSSTPSPFDRYYRYHDHYHYHDHDHKHRHRHERHRKNHIHIYCS